MNEPRWRTVLCWSAVVTFFTMPAVIFILHVVAVEHEWNTGQRWQEFTGISAFYQTIAALVFGLAGLRSFDRAWEIKYNGKQKQPQLSYNVEPPEQSSSPVQRQSKRSNTA